MALALVAYPDLEAEDLDWIQSIRQRNDPTFPIIGVHFTFVFPLSGMPEAAFVAHVTEVLRPQPPIAFELRTATMVADPDGAHHFVFLVPKVGHDAMTALRARLHTGPLKPHLRLETPFGPHLTVARTDRPAAARALATSLNGRTFAIAGRPQRFAVIEAQETGIREITELTLRPAPTRDR